MMDIKALDAEGFANLPPGEQGLVVMLITRQEVDELNIGSAVDRLLEMSDHPERAASFAGSVVFSIDGFNEDRRELYEVPAVRDYFKALDEAWPLMGYFAATDLENELLMQLALLTPVRVYRSNGQVGLSLDRSSVSKQIQRWRQAMAVLSEQHGGVVARKVTERMLLLDTLELQL